MKTTIGSVFFIALFCGLSTRSFSQDLKTNNPVSQSRHAISMNVDYFPLDEDYFFTLGLGVNMNYYYEFIPDKLRINPSFGIGIYNKPLLYNQGYMENTMYIRCFLDWTFFRKNWFYLNLGVGVNGTFAKSVNYSSSSPNGSEISNRSFGFQEFIPAAGVNFGLGFTLPNERLSIEFYPFEVWWKMPDIGLGLKSSVGLKVKL